MEKHSFETYVDEDAMYGETSAAVEGGQTEDSNIGMDAEIEVDEEEVNIYMCFTQNIIFLDQAAVQSGRDPRGISICGKKINLPSCPFRSCWGGCRSCFKTGETQF